MRLGTSLWQRAGQWRRWPLVAAMVLSTALVAACGGAAPKSEGAPTAAPAVAAPATATRTPLSGTVTVFAASSLTDVFKAIGAEFQRTNPGVRVEFNFAASSALAAQIGQGAPADVYASADTANMQKVTDQSLIDGTPATFARNRPVIVVPAANAAKIGDARDLARPGTKLVLAAASVPIGSYSRQIIDRLAAMPDYGSAYREATLRNIVSNEQNVRAVLTKIELGEADAGIVYQTDALVSKEKVKTIAIPDGANVVALYPIGVVKETKNREAAAAFLGFVTGPQGQALLLAAGFTPGS